MSTQKISLNDKFDLSKSPVLLNGTQALVRLMLMQKERDRAAGQAGKPRCRRHGCLLDRRRPIPMAARFRSRKGAVVHAIEVGEDPVLVPQHSSFILRFSGETARSETP